MSESDEIEDTRASLSFRIRDWRNRNALVIQKLHLNSRFRFEWKAENGSNDSMWIHGYYCPVFHDGYFRGVFDQRSNGFRDDIFYISNEKFHTFLRPDEKRTYVWDWVFPSYYGIDAPGKWSFSLKFSYVVQGKAFVTRPKRATILIEEAPKSSISTIGSRLRMLLSDGIVLEMLAEHLGKLKPLLDISTSYLFKAGALGRIDFLARNDSGLVVIEAKAVADEQTLKQVAKYVDWVRATFGHAFGDNVRAVVIAYEIDMKEKDLLTVPYQLWVFKYIEERKLQLVKAPAS